MKYLTGCLLIFLNINLIAQNYKSKADILNKNEINNSFELDKYKITGRLIDQEQKQPLEYATVGIFKPGTETLVKSTVTDFDGKFSVKIIEGIYDIRFEYISYETKTFKKIKVNADKDLGEISLKFKASELDEVNVVSETTKLDVRLDKKIYTLGKDLTVAGGTVTEALENVPSVSVDIEGGISLRGNENVRILINGKPSALAGFGNTDVLQQLPADAIEKVEVITSPSARYDAQGTAGIINIVLKRDKTLGFNGSVRLQTGTPLNNRAAANLNWRTEQFNFFGNIGYSHRKPPGNASFESNFSNDNPDREFDRVIEDRSYNRNRKDFNFNIGATYFFDYNTSITASYFGRTGEDDDLTNNFTSTFNEGEFINERLRQEREIEDEESYQVSLNFNKKFDNDGHELDTEFQYSEDSEYAPTIITEDVINGEDQFIPDESVIEREDQTEYLLQADYVRPMGESQFEAGFRINLENNKEPFFREFETEENEVQVDTVLTNDFEFDENVYAVYAQYGDKFGDFSFLLGLRYEYTQLQGKTTSDFDLSVFEELLGEDVDLNFDNKFDGLFPTLNLIYELGEDENFTLGYNRRINRPRGWYLNPTPSLSSRTNIFQGNPSLRPAFANAVDLGYLKRWDEKFTLTTSVYYQRETDAFERIDEEVGTTADGLVIIRSIPINLSTNQRMGFEVGALYNPTEWLNINWSVNGFRFETDGFFNGQDFGVTNNSITSRFSAKVELPYKIQWQTNVNYQGPFENAQTKTKSITSVNLALSKDILNDNATISVNVRDLFNSRVRDRITTAPTFTRDSSFQWRERQISATFIYRFNQNKERNEGQRDGDYGGDGGY
ncbi:MAG: TonB-dependent receptor [Bacteroidetes bacterium]|jgi:outer membrane receptor protein involved in Fe transport|nr:TonB-dependent receptor [Bacteroidota bacterium]